MKQRYIFFHGMIDTLDLYTEEFVRIYTAKGAECLVIDTTQMEHEMLRLKAFLLQPVTAVISLNNIGLHLEFEDGRNIWDRYQIPFYNIMMDHPFHYKNTLDAAPEQMTLLCMDRNHVEYVKRFFPHVKNTVFFPHAGIELHQPLDMHDRIPIQERQIDILYAGGLSRYAAEGLIPDLGRITDFDAFLLVKQVLEKLIQQPEFTTEYVIEQSLKELNISYKDEVLGGMISELRFLDSLAVSFYREQVIRTLVENGFTVTVFGRGWERLEWEHPNLVYGGEIRPRQILELMNQSKIVLNTMTWFKQGAHDRIFNGMLAGAAVVSDTSGYMEAHFTSGQELQLFSLREINNLPKMINNLLEHPKQMQNIADCGYQAAKEHHMWINRLQALG